MSAKASPQSHENEALDDEPPAEALLGRVIGERYELEEVLGCGSMGTVYRARHRRLDRMMAVKVLRPALAHDAESAERFSREALAISKLDHDNCVQVIDFGSEDGLQYLVMQLLDGPSLRASMGRPLPVARAVDVAVQILHGLEHAHRRGLVHRDLKPENVIVVHGPDGRDVAKLVDFGLARLVKPPSTQRRLTQAGVVFGTPVYMSPEHVSGAEVDPRSDLYAVGVILYELLSGEPPFFHDDPATLAAMHVTREPPPLPHGLPPALGPVIGKLLAKKSRDRHRTARAAASALQRAVASPTGSGGLRTTAPYTDPAAVVRRAALAPGAHASPAASPPRGPAPAPTLRPFRVAPPTGRAAVRARATTSIDATLPRDTPSSSSPKGDESPAGLRPTHRRGLWIDAVPSAVLERRAAFARVDHALVERPVDAPTIERTRARAGRLTIAVLAIAIALALALVLTAR